MNFTAVLPHIVFFLLGVFLAGIVTDGVQSAGESPVSLERYLAASLSFLFLPVVGAILALRGKKKQGFAISALSPFVGAATFLLTIDYFQI